MKFKLILIKRLARRISVISLEACSIVVFFMKVPYWYMIRVIMYYWKRGLHSVTIGEFKGGLSRKRSSYRENMLIKTILMFINLKNRSCLDLACDDGFWSFRLARFGLKSVSGIDRSKESIAKANLLKRIYDFPSFQFKQQDIFDSLYDSKQKSYDIILLLSIIYHLPEETDWDKFFSTLSRMNNECLIIDSRWFEDDKYWYDKTSGQAFIKTKKGLIKKWRPLKKEVCEYLYKNGYEYVIDINPSTFLIDSQEAYGNGDPYTLKNVSDYITANRTIIIAYKAEKAMPNFLDGLAVTHIKQDN